MGVALLVALARQDSATLGSQSVSPPETEAKVLAHTWSEKIGITNLMRGCDRLCRMHTRRYNVRNAWAGDADQGWLTQGAMNLSALISFPSADRSIGQTSRHGGDSGSAGAAGPATTSNCRQIEDAIMARERPARSDQRSNRGRKRTSNTTVQCH